VRESPKVVQLTLLPNKESFVQAFLDVRTAVLNATLELAFRRRHHGFRPANDDHRLTASAA
jgi:hypothetical protein